MSENYAFAQTEFVTIESVCNATKLSKSTIYRMKRDLEFPASVKFGRKRSLWLWGEIEKWMLSKAG